MPPNRITRYDRFQDGEGNVEHLNTNGWGKLSQPRLDFGGRHSERGCNGMKLRKINGDPLLVRFQDAQTQTLTENVF